LHHHLDPEHSLFGYSYSSLQAAAPGSLEFDSAAAPDPPLVSDFCHGPAGAPPKDTSPTTTSIQKPSLFDNSYSSMQAEAPGSLEFVGGLQFKGASEDWGPKLKPVRRPPHYTSSTTTSTLKHTLFGYSYSSLQAAAPGSLEFDSVAAPDPPLVSDFCYGPAGAPPKDTSPSTTSTRNPVYSVAAPDPPLVSDFCYGPAGAPPKDTSPSTTSTQKPSLFDNSYSSMQAAAPGSLEFVGGLQFKGASEDWDLKLKPVRRPPHYTSSTTTSTLKHSLFGYSYSSLQAAAPGSLEFDSAAAPDPPLVSDFCYGPAGAPPKDTSPTTTSTQKPSLFDNSYSSMQAAAPGSLEFVGGLQFKGASEDWDPKLKPVRSPHYTSSTTTSTLKHSLFGYSYSSLQAAAPGSLEFDSAAAPDPPLVSDFCHGPAGAPTKDTSPTTTSTQKPSLFDNSYSSMQAAAPGSLEFDSAAAPDPPLVSDFCYGPAGAPPKDTSPTTTSTQKPSLFDNSYSSMQAAAPGTLEFDSVAAPDPPLVSDFCHGPAGAPPKDTSPTTTSTQKPSLFDNSYSSLQAEAPGSLEFDSAAAPDPPLVSDFCYGPAGAPPKDTSPTTTSTQKPSLFDNSYSSMQAAAPGSLEFDSAAAPDPPLVSDFCHGPAGAPPKDTSPTTTSTQKPSLFDNSYSSMQAAAPGSLEFDSVAAPDPPLVSDFCYGPAGAPPKDTSPSTTSTQKPSLFDYSYSSLQAPAPGSLEFDSAAAPDQPLVSDFCHGPAGAPPKDTSPTTTSTQKPSLFDNSYSSMQAAAPGSLEFVGGSQFEGASEDWDPNPEPVWRPPHYTSSSSGDPTNTTSSTTTSTLKHTLFGYSYSSLQAPAPGSPEFAGGSQFKGASEDWDPNPEPVWRPRGLFRDK
ncbi:unnamed protein product, partial [Pleuronectes platessa]